MIQLPIDRDLSLLAPSVNKRITMLARTSPKEASLVSTFVRISKTAMLTRLRRMQASKSLRKRNLSRRSNKGNVTISLSKRIRRQPSFLKSMSRAERFQKCAKWSKRYGISLACLKQHIKMQRP